MKLKQLQNIFLITATFCIVSLFLIVVIVPFLNWNFARPYIDTILTKSLGRKFETQGNLSFKFVFCRPTFDGCKYYTPLIQIKAENIKLANPEWASGKTSLFQSSIITLTFDPLPLLKREVNFTEIYLSRPILYLERQEDFQNNWSIFSSTANHRQWKIDHIYIDKGELRYVDKPANFEGNFFINSSISAPELEDDISFRLVGNYAKAKISGEGHLKSMKFSSTHKKYSLVFEGNTGSNKVNVEGEINPGNDLAIADLKLSVSGTSLANLFPLIPVVLPKSPPYTIKGRLGLSREKEGNIWKYENITGKVGESDLEGNLEFVTEPHPFLRGKLHSTLLQLSDLAPTIGVVSKSTTSKNNTLPPFFHDKTLPTENFVPRDWVKMNAEVSLYIKKILRTHNIPLENIKVHFSLKEGMLTLHPFDFNLAGGKVISTLILNGQKELIQAQVNLAARHLKIREFFPSSKIMQSSFGEIAVDAVLVMQGNSLASMLSSADGRASAYVNEGSISKFILEAAGLNIANAVFVKIFGDRQIHLNCINSQLLVRKGIVYIQTFLLDTDDALIKVAGNVDLRDEWLNIEILPQSKGLRILTLRTPLYAKGSFTKPDIGYAKGPLLSKTLSALALGAIFPPLAVIPLIKIDEQTSVECSALATKQADFPTF